MKNGWAISLVASGLSRRWFGGPPGTLPLQWAQKMPNAATVATTRQRYRLPSALNLATGVRAYCMWTFLTTAGTGLITIYLPETLEKFRLTTTTNLELDIWLRTPAMIIATLFGPRSPASVAGSDLWPANGLCLVSICSGVVWQQDTPWLLWLCAGTDGIWRGLRQ